MALTKGKKGDGGCACRVPLEDVADAVGFAVDQLQVDPDLVGPYWDGRPSVAVDVASELVARIRGYRERDSRNSEAYRRYVEDRNADRAEAVAEALDGMRRRVHAEHPVYAGMGPSGPLGGVLAGAVAPEGRHRAAQLAPEVAEQAGAEFDREQPAMSREQFVVEHGQVAT